MQKYNNYATYPKAFRVAEINDSSGLQPILSWLFAGEEALQVVQRLEGLEGRQIVDLQGQQAVADLLKQRVVKLEETQLISVAGGA